MSIYSKNDAVNHLKIIIVGDSGTGKTSIITRYIKQTFEPNNKATIVPLYSSKVLTINGNKYQFNIWDIPGQDRNPVVTRSFAQDAQGIIYCCEVKKTKESLKSWEESLNSFTDTKEIPKIIVENKCDLLGDESFYNEDINILRETAKKLECFKFFRTSALNGYNVNGAFNALMNEMIKNVKIKGIERRNSFKLRNNRGSTNAKCC
jgi:small GTP-binding protein